MMHVLSAMMGRKGWVLETMLVGLACAVDLIGVLGDVGTATSYSPPYLRKLLLLCSSRFMPGNGHFVAAGSGIWDNGAACGRRYRLRCLSGLRRSCKDGSIVVEVVDFCRHSPCPSTLVLSTRAFDAVSKIPDTKINVEYTQ
ncbi:hypothetical protein BHE74_00018689 [Ensete ventricosum]|nr:hypothetical protein GW17_00043151 [Ensete ventricosum]RWW73431.1 hypothetical protein BHE74_00018689 [Ensete ventricosum]RZS14615.1 hypothetical protein BHM03_00046337 [Ensete ventricosum]